MNLKKLAKLFLSLTALCSSLSFANTPVTIISNSGYETVYSMDGQTLISNADKSIKYFEAATGKLKKTIKVSSLPPIKNDQFYIEYRADYTIGLFDIASGKQINVFPGFSDYEFTADEMKYYFGKSIGKKLKEKRRKWGYKLKQTHAVALTPDGQYLAACSKSDKFKTKIWDAKSGTLIKEVSLKEILKSKTKARSRRSAVCASLTVASNGRYFFINDSKGGMYLLEAKTGELLGTPLIADNYAITASALSAGGNTLVAINNFGTLHIWNIKENKLIKKIQTKNYNVRLLSTTSNGNYVAYIEKGNIFIWDIKAEKLIQTYLMFDTAVTYKTFSISFSPDDKFIATVDAANAKLIPQIKIWDVTGEVTRQRLKDSRLDGIVYKSNHFWQQFNNFDVMKKTFNGEFGGLERKKLFRVHYRDFVQQYGLHCPLSGQIDARRFTMHRVTEDEYGNEVSKEKTTDVTTRMEHRFTDKYDEYKRIYNWFYTSMGFSNVLNQKQLNLSQMPGVQIEHFIKNAPCHSASMFQMKENLWRAAYGKPSLQDEGIKIPNAENESDSVEDMLSEKTLYQSCMSNNGSKKYCTCFDKKAREIMTGDELTHYSKDFSNYYKEVTQKVGGNDKHSDLWRLYEAHRSGLRCK